MATEEERGNGDVEGDRKEAGIVGFVDDEDKELWGITGEPFEEEGGRILISDGGLEVERGTNSSTNSSASDSDTKPSAFFPDLSILFPTTTQQ
jgi:hypothetical protein